MDRIGAPTLAEGQAAAGERSQDRLRRLLAGHVPVSLIMDLAMPQGPHSDELLEAEQRPHPW